MKKGKIGWQGETESSRQEDSHYKRQNDIEAADRKRKADSLRAFRKENMLSKAANHLREQHKD